MPALRDHLGKPCPSCRNDILQAAPTTNRMPGAELAWCPSCKATLTVAQLERGGKGRAGGFFARLLGRPQRG